MRAANVDVFWELLSTPKERIEPLMRFHTFPLEEYVKTVALIRWLAEDGTNGPEVVNAFLKARHWTPKPQSETADDCQFMDEPLPVQFLVEWAIRDKRGFHDWLEKQYELYTPHARGVDMAVSFVSSGGSAMGYEGLGGEPCYAHDSQIVWAGLDPDSAFPSVWNDYGTLTYGNVVDRASDTFGINRPNLFNYYMHVMEAYGMDTTQNPLFMILEDWDDTDAAATARYGVRWMLRVHAYSHEILIRLWRAQVDTWNEELIDRHFGALRVWSVRRPEAVRAWIASESFDDDVKAALNWLVDHAANGYPLRKVGEGDNATYVPDLPP